VTCDTDSRTLVYHNTARLKDGRIKIKWVTGNVKTLGIHHGYDIQDDNIWKSIIETMKSCIHVKKSRNLTFVGKTLIIENILLSLSGYEIEMRGIPHKYICKRNK
jgi:hypothetical protein